LEVRCIYGFYAIPYVAKRIEYLKYYNIKKMRKTDIHTHTQYTTITRTLITHSCFRIQEENLPGKNTHIGTHQQELAKGARQQT
jgi:hypothetical protein